MDWHTMQGRSPMYKCSRKLQRVRHNLFKWCREYRTSNNIIWDDVMEKCCNTQSNIENLTDMDIDEDTRKESLDQAMIKLAYWKQRAKGKWATLGDNNTSYFYRCAQSRKSKNKVRMLQKENGDWVSEPQHIEEEISKNFKEHGMQVYYKGILMKKRLGRQLFKQGH